MRDLRLNAQDNCDIQYIVRKVRLMAALADLHARGAAVFGSDANGVHWPCEVNGIDITLRRTDPERFRQEQADRTRRRELIVEWAERHGLKASTVSCCPAWGIAEVSPKGTTG